VGWGTSGNGRPIVAKTESLILKMKNIDRPERACRQLARCGSGRPGLSGSKRATSYELSEACHDLAVECRLRKATNMVPSTFARREGGRVAHVSFGLDIGSRNAGSPGPCRLAASTHWDSTLSNPHPRGRESVSSWLQTESPYYHGKSWWPCCIRALSSVTQVCWGKTFLLRMS
jgi:hypothetical protein